jgi:hypothetical protein
MARGAVAVRTSAGTDVTYEMMEAGWRPPAQTGARPDWMEPFARTIDAAKKYVVSSTLDRVDWNAELVRGDLGKAVQQLKRESGKGLFVGGVKLPQALAELGLTRGAPHAPAATARPSHAGTIRPPLPGARVCATKTCGSARENACDRIGMSTENPGPSWPTSTNRWAVATSKEVSTRHGNSPLHSR